MSFLSPDAASLLHLVRENLRLLGELAFSHEGSGLSPRSGGKVVRGPLDLVAYLGPEMADLPQEQLRVVLLDTKNHVLGITLVYQGGLNSLVVRLADVFREAVARGAAAIILVHNHPGRPDAVSRGRSDDRGGRPRGRAPRHRRPRPPRDRPVTASSA